MILTIRRIFLVLLVLPAVPSFSAAQASDSALRRMGNVLELNADRIESEDESGAAEQAVDFLEELKHHPLDPNTATVVQLQQIPYINLPLAEKIVRFRQGHLFEEIADLKSVKGIGPATLARISPFLRINRPALHKNLHFWTAGSGGQYLVRFQHTLTPGKGYDPDSGKTGYLGSPAKIYHRLTLSGRHFSLNLTQEKDPGERWDGKFGFDFTSAHLALYNVGLLRRAVIGDYGLSFGQGLALSTSGSFGMGGQVTGGAIHSNRGLYPYASTDENHFLRGFALSLGSRLSATLFYSKRRYSARVIQGDTIAFPGFTGYYRTPTEYGRRYDAGHHLYGGHLGWSFPSGFVGFTAYRSHFDRYIARDSRYYRRNYFYGRDAGVISVNYQLRLAGPVVFGEAARSENGAWAFITGIRARLTPKTDWLFSWRDYSSRFHSIFGNALSEKSGYPQGEQGFYTGLRLRLPGRLVLRTCLDQFYFPEPRYGVHTGSRGYEWLGRLVYTGKNGFSVTLLGSYQAHGSDANTADSLGRTEISTSGEDRLRIRGGVEMNPTPRLRLNSRLEWVQSSPSGKNPSRGFLLYQEVRWKPIRNIQITARYCLFDTDDYDSRVYAYESDLLYVFSIPALYDQGRRIYAVIKWSPFPSLTFWGKIGVTRLINHKTIGSGLNLIPGNEKKDMGVMARLTW